MSASTLRAPPLPRSDGTALPAVVTAPARRTFADRLRTHRLAAGLTQEELADVTCVSIRAIRNLETGRTAHPQRRSVLLLANGLGLRDEALHDLLDAAHPPRSAAAAEPAADLPGDTCELPAGPQDLVGRDEQAGQISAFLTAEAAGRRVGLAIVTGAPGTGKTALAVHVATRLRSRFPDFQLFVDAQRPDGTPKSAEAIQLRMLRSLGIARPTDDSAEASAAVRAALCSCRLIVVVDNVTDESQVQPLLTRTTSSVVVAVTRPRMSALDHGRTWRLRPLGEETGIRLLAAHAGPSRVRAEPDAARAVVRLCHGLPLAVRIAGCWLDARPHRSLRALADFLARDRTGLATLHAGDLDLRVSIGAYHRLLAATEREVLARLARIGRAEFSSQDACRLAGVGAQEALDSMVRLHLVDVADTTDGPRYQVVAPTGIDGVHTPCLDRRSA